MPSAFVIHRSVDLVPLREFIWPAINKRGLLGIVFYVMTIPIESVQPPNIFLMQSYNFLSIRQNDLGYFFAPICRDCAYIYNKV